MIPETTLRVARPTDHWNEILRFYRDGLAHRQAAVARMEAQGFVPVPSYNPYWDRAGKTFEDSDGYRVVLQNATWPR